jgi:hypothetical protein
VNLCGEIIELIGSPCKGKAKSPPANRRKGLGYVEKLASWSNGVEKIRYLHSAVDTGKTRDTRQRWTLLLQ